MIILSGAPQTLVLIVGENGSIVQATVYMFSTGSSENSKTQILDPQSTRKKIGQHQFEREKRCDKI